ncbi:conserved hypothetical protein [Neospora caninum Liverpool]|uniref:PH domain-containing protein n=1 Tax=Neospora caninum (strain Liverpool) TaxID=572307 RepID=F0VIK5_NEOCL|nr:conserved hypothetical protein [Neospora caninum Liverpool]CBZ53566.1 conserved hypothetical protein [Neospora caninum Liverpool]CEL67554.1 TPA: hypothetical protein BN1204_033530 [Neospora caninum Liverpool]|eukprot:XP_003883598.1 conserved hypothetical protein [Neospora caninum Liverpool]
MPPSPDSNTEPPPEGTTRSCSKRGNSTICNLDAEKLTSVSRRAYASLPSRAEHESLSTSSKSVQNGGDYDVEWHGFRDSSVQRLAEDAKISQGPRTTRDRLNIPRVDSPTVLNRLIHPCVKRKADRSGTQNNSSEDTVWLLGSRSEKQSLSPLSQKEAVYLVIDNDVVPVNARDLALRWSWVFRGLHCLPMWRENRPLIQGWIWKLKKKSDSLSFSLALATRASRIPYVGRHLVANKRFITIDIENRVFYYRKGNRNYSMPFYFNDIVSVDVCELTWAKEFGFCGIHLRSDTLERSVCFCVKTKTAFHTWLYAFLLVWNTRNVLPYPMLPHGGDGDRGTILNTSGDFVCHRLSPSFDCTSSTQRTSSGDRRKKGRKWGISRIFVKFWRVSVSTIFTTKSQENKRTQDAACSEDFLAEHGPERKQISSCKKFTVNEHRTHRPPFIAVSEETTPSTLSVKSRRVLCDVSCFCTPAPTGLKSIRSLEVLDEEHLKEKLRKSTRPLIDTWLQNGSHLLPGFLDSIACEQRHFPLPRFWSPFSRQKRNETVHLTDAHPEFSRGSLNSYKGETQLEEGIAEGESAGKRGCRGMCLLHDYIHVCACLPQLSWSDISSNQKDSVNSVETNDESFTEPSRDSFLS